MINYETYCKIRDCRERQQLTLVQTARALGLNAQTVAKWAKFTHYRARRHTPRSSRLDPFKERVLLLLEMFPYSAQQIHRRLREKGFDGGLTIVKDYVHTIRANGGGSFDGFGWMLAVLQKQISSEDLKHQISDVPELDVLLDRLYTGRLIESVFSGMSRAIIHSSDYPSIDAAKGAINRYFDERNDHFQKNNQRAGRKIWGKEREPAAFSDSSNCKDPRYR